MVGTKAWETTLLDEIAAAYRNLFFSASRAEEKEPRFLMNKRYHSPRCNNLGVVVVGCYSSLLFPVSCLLSPFHGFDSPLTYLVQHFLGFPGVLLHLLLFHFDVFDFRSHRSILLWELVLGLGVSFLYSPHQHQPRYLFSSSSMMWFPLYPRLDGSPSLEDKMRGGG